MSGRHTKNYGGKETSIIRASACWIGLTCLRLLASFPKQSRLFVPPLRSPQQMIQPRSMTPSRLEVGPCAGAETLREVTSARLGVDGWGKEERRGL